MARKETRSMLPKIGSVLADLNRDPVITCILCGASESCLVQVGVRYAPEAVVRRCRVCELVFLWPRPNEQELAAYYAVAYRAEYDGAVSPEKTYRKGVEEARARVSRLLPYLTPTARVLEVGSSAGAFLEAVRPYVQSVMGVEPDVAHRKRARSAIGVDVVPNLKDVGEQRFDLIGLFHTLEHVPEPVAFLRELSGYLGPRGKIAIELPNVNDALLALYKVPAFSGFYFQRAHLYYFSPQTLEHIIKAAGGKAEISGVQRYDLSNHLRWLITGEPGGQGYYRAVFPDSLQSAYAEALIRAGYADTLWAIVSF